MNEREKVRTYITTKSWNKTNNNNNIDIANDMMNNYQCV